MSVRMFLRRLAPIDGVPRTLVLGMMTGDDAVTDGADDQLVVAHPGQAGVIAETIQWAHRGEIEIDVDGRGVYESTAGMSNETVVAALGRARIKGRP